MKKIIFLFIVCLLCACQQNKNENQEAIDYLESAQSAMKDASGTEKTWEKVKENVYTLEYDNQEVILQFTFDFNEKILTGEMHYPQEEHTQQFSYDWVNQKGTQVMIDSCKLVLDRSSHNFIKDECACERLNEFVDKNANNNVWADIESILIDPFVGKPINPYHLK